MATVKKSVTVYTVDFSEVEFKTLTKLLGKTSNHDITIGFGMSEGDDKRIEEIYRTFSLGGE